MYAPDVRMSDTLMVIKNRTRIKPEVWNEHALAVIDGCNAVRYLRFALEDIIRRWETCDVKVSDSAWAFKECADIAEEALSRFEWED